jgi:hypothetical protein
MVEISTPLTCSIEVADEVFQVVQAVIEKISIRRMLCGILQANEQSPDPHHVHQFYKHTKS